jgi:hypothetical protein
MMERSYAMRTIDTIYSTALSSRRTATTERRCSIPRPSNRSARFASATPMMWTSRLPQPNAGDECHHPLHEAASPFPDPGVMSAGYLH